MKTQESKTTLPLNETFIPPKEYSLRFGRSISSQCRDRRDGLGPPFIVHGNQVLYPLSLAMEYWSSKLVQSSAEVPIDVRGNRYKHLPAARAKANAVRRNRLAS